MWTNTGELKSEATYVNGRWVFNAGIYLDETGKFATNISLLEGLLLLRVRRCLPIDETVPMAGRSGAGIF
jgi:hypothetical protein